MTEAITPAEETLADAPKVVKWMPDWQHTHDLSYRKRVWPVMSKMYMGMQLMFRADGMVEWMRHPVQGWALRGARVHGVTLRSVVYKPGAKTPPLELFSEAVPELQKAGQ